MSGRDLATGLSWTVGSTKVTSIVEQDLWWRIERFLPDAKPEVVASIPWIEPFLDDDPSVFPLRVQALIIDTGTHVALVDTCVGNDKPRDFWSFDQLATSFLDEMAAAGYPPEGVDSVVCTHLHVDHVGWNTHLVGGEWLPTFPNARYLFGSDEYNYWVRQTDDLTKATFADSVEPILHAGLADFVPGDHVIADGIRLQPTVGHTPGHVSVRIESEGQHAVIIGDMSHHPIQLQRPEIFSTADVDPAQATATRRTRFAEWESDSVLVIGTHFAPPTAGHLRSTDDGWQLIS